MIDQIEWDLAMVTAGDYSVEFDIPKSAYKDWYEKIYKKPGGEFELGYSPALSLKRYMAIEIESIL